eukprot:gene11095-11249_t
MTVKGGVTMTVKGGWALDGPCHCLRGSGAAPIMQLRVLVASCDATKLDVVRVMMNALDAQLTGRWGKALEFIAEFEQAHLGSGAASVYGPLRFFPENKGLPVSTTMMNVICRAIARLGNTEATGKVFESYGVWGLAPDADSYNAVMESCEAAKKVAAVEGLISYMTSKGVQPTGASWALLLSTALRAEDHQAANSVIDRMRMTGVNPGHGVLKKAYDEGLRSLQIDKLYLLQPQQLSCISRLTQLTHLSLGGPHVSNLRSHHLAFISCLKSLKHISIRGCSKVHLTVVSYWHGLTQLRSLSLINVCYVATDATCLYNFLAAGAAANLTSLVLGNSQGLSFLSDNVLQGLGQLLGPHKALKVLDLSGCIDVTDAGMQQLLGLTGLQRLQLHNCMKVHGGALQVIATFTSLTHLNLRGCSQFTDAALQHLLRHLPALQSLNLQSCSGLSGSFLDVAACSMATCLQTLNMSYCQSLKAESLQGIKQLLALQRLDLTGCGMVSGPAALQVLAQLRQLRQLLGGHLRLKGGWEMPAAAAGTSNSNCTCGAVQQQFQAEPDKPPELTGTPPGSCGRTEQGALSALSDRDLHQQQVQPKQQLLMPPLLEHLRLNDLTCEDGLLQGIINSLPTSLTSLDLSNCRVPGFGVAGACLQGLQRLKLLQSLNLSGSCGGLAEGGVQCLAELLCLTELQLDHIHTSRQDAWLPESCLQQQAVQQQAQRSQAAASSDVMIGLEQQDNHSKGANTTSSSSSNDTRMSCDVAVRRSLFPFCALDALRTRPAATNLALSAVHGTEITAGTEGVEWHLMLQHQKRKDQIPLQRQQQLLAKPCFLQALYGIKKLSISFSPWLDDGALASLSGLVERSLVSLDLIACHSFSGSGFKAWTYQNAAAAAAGGAGSQSSLWASSRHLTRLNFTGCSGLSNDGLIWLVQALSGASLQPCVQGQPPFAGTAARAEAGQTWHSAAAQPSEALCELNLAGCRGIADSGVASISVLTGLRLLNLSSNKNITSWAIAQLFPALCHLRQCQLSLCAALDDNALTHLVAGASLTTLDLRGCWKITDAGAKQGMQQQAASMPEASEQDAGLLGGMSALVIALR